MSFWPFVAVLIIGDILGGKLFLLHPAVCNMVMTIFILAFLNPIDMQSVKHIYLHCFRVIPVIASKWKSGIHILYLVLALYANITVSEMNLSSSLLPPSLNAICMLSTVCAMLISAKTFARFSFAWFSLCAVVNLDKSILKFLWNWLAIVLLKYLFCNF